MANLAILPLGQDGIRQMVLPTPSQPVGTMALVRMVRTPINPADLLAIEGRYAFELDATSPLGAEGVGIVEAVGPSATGVRPGDAVLPLARGNWCRYRLLEERDLVVLPTAIDLDQAAMLRINPLTARLLLDGASLRPGDMILQNGAGSIVARWVRFFAARSGIAVLDVVRRADAELPDAIIDGPQLAARVKAIAAGRQIRAAFDCVAGEATGRVAECLDPGGRLMLFGHLSGEPIIVPSQFLTRGGLSIVGFSLRPAEVALGNGGIQRKFAELFSMMVDRLPSVLVRTILPLSNAQAAIAAAREGGKGRVLLDCTA